MLAIELLPAAHGDALWLEYGPAGQENRVLIDGGPAPTYEGGLRARIGAAPEQGRHVELMVVTHIDADHIDGALILLQEFAALNVRIDELWFNGWTQLGNASQVGSYAPLQGEFLDALIDVNPDLDRVWNARFDGKPVGVADSGPLPVVKLPGGAQLTLLGPTQRDLRRLGQQWSAAVRDFTPGDTDEALRRLAERRQYRPPAPPPSFAVPKYGDDSSVANGSSISFVFEYGGASLLLAGDAHARTLEASLKRLANERSVARLHFDAVKLPHHGSMNNVSEAWLQLVETERWLISTNGDVFNHPDLETVTLIAGGHSQPTLLCNYQKIADMLNAQAEGQWQAGAPTGEMAGPTGGLRVNLPAGG